MLSLTLIVLLALLALSVAAAVSVGLLGMSLSQLFSTLPLSSAMGEIAWNTSSEFLLVAIPLYILMGELLVCSGVAGRMYQAVEKWLSWLPGGLMNSNIGASALFATTSGSSVATAATLSTLAIPEQERKGYNAPLFLGSIAAGGTLGILIPPSINMILFALIANVSVPKLYLAATVPSIILSVLFIALIVLACLIRPQLDGRKAPTRWAERLACLPDLLPPLAIFALVIGSIYSGFATASESAALGVLSAFGLGLWRRAFTWQSLGQAFEATLRTTGMIMLITLSAFFLNFVLASIGLTTTLVHFVTDLNLSPTATLLAIILFYIVLGCFMDTLAMLITTAPLIVPIIVALGFDPLWFGVVLIVLCEMGQITPPFGMNLFVVQSIRGRGNFMDVVYGALPFCLALLVLIALLIAFPQLALWLPAAV
ncbi:Sialic acid TRAP transporter permease protein SiaT [compost metagenome]|jgi:TRAP transporter, DctM subunit|uniref:TRAP transporter large permease protein n=1 Tax=Pseudomonas capeferrum TaxID=1495066 RepID=A0ABY7RFF3_9PSED|nr:MULTISPECIES: TRAP transporter large permease [Pseudomonas]KGI94308.1 membrane protein [Pseudomonas sp. H2]MDD2063076.1 TRAP transporter large permease [Pseudomonas sp. 25571]MUT50024.1 TRAP transporter large permease subunit [Pseudomonas sp. TDA1]UDU83092.1 TRAP transporter large permease [Pseudomonas sp. HN2-3]UPL09385.1 Neu5Ac permease [Pseudomonas sp. IsoF]